VSGLTLTWIDTTSEENWLPGLRSAVLLLRAGWPVFMWPGAPAGSPYLAAAGLTDGAVHWLEDQGATLVAGHGPSENAELVSLKAPAVAIFGGAGSPYNHAAVIATLGLPWFYAHGGDIADGILRHADLLVVPGGGWRFGNGLLGDLGEAGVAAMLEFVEAGGGYLSSCAGTMIAMRMPEASLERWHGTKDRFTLLEVENWDPLRSAEGGHRSPGIGRVIAQPGSTRHPVALGLPEQLEITHYNGPIFAEPGPGIDVALRYAGTTEGFTPSECFHSHPGRPTTNDQQRSLMAEAGRQSLPAVVAGERGRGRVVLAGLHPEFGLDSSLDNWGRPAQLIGNAILWQAQHGRGANPSFPVQEAAIAEAQTALDQAIGGARQAITRLQEADAHAKRDWLSDSALRAAFGQTAAELWLHALDSLGPLLDRVAAAWSNALEVSDETGQRRIAAAALQRYEPDGGPDLGAQGAVWLIAEATRLIVEAASVLATEEPAAAEHRVSRSYLSAVGLLTNAAQRLESETATSRAENDLRDLRSLLQQTPVGAAI
jgi:hypothetical protein